MARVRSPNFPAISLPEAIDRIVKIYAKEQTIPATRDTIAEHLGYSGMNGASLKVVSALLKYGLLEEAKDKHLKVSDLAMAIMHPASDQEKTDALRQAAEGPALFQKLNTQFEGRRPSDTNLRSWLLRNGFGASAVDSVISAYSETMDLVGGVADVYNAPEAKAGNDTAPQERKVHVHAVQDRPAVKQQAPAGEPFSIELLRDRFRVAGELTSKADAEKLIEMLKLAANFLPETPTPIAEIDDDDESLQ